MNRLIVIIREQFSPPKPRLRAYSFPIKHSCGHRVRRNIVALTGDDAARVAFDLSFLPCTPCALKECDK